MEQSEEKRNGDHIVEDVAINQDHQNFADNDVRKFREFSQKPDLYDLLIDSLAPSIWENQDVKKGILTQLFGGVSKEL
jgi:DNA replication licensing factor MCM4